MLNNAVCDICGKPYHVCQTCKNITSFKPWRTVTDTLPHYMIYLAISDYTKTKDKSKAKEELSKCDLSELDNFRPEIKNVINEIMGTQNATKNNKTVLKKSGSKDNNIE